MPWEKPMQHLHNMKEDILYVFSRACSRNAEMLYKENSLLIATSSRFLWRSFSCVESDTGTFFVCKTSKMHSGLMSELFKKKRQI